MLGRTSRRSGPAVGIVPVPAAAVSELSHSELSHGELSHRETVGGHPHACSMTTYQASIEGLLEAFLQYVGAERTEATRDRYRRVIDHLHLYLDSSDAEFWLGTDAAQLIAHERQFEPNRAFARLFTIDELLCALPGFLAPKWLMAKPGDARSQVTLIDKMLRTNLVRGLADDGSLFCVVLDCRRAVKEARAELALRARVRK